MVLSAPALQCLNRRSCIMSQRDGALAVMVVTVLIREDGTPRAGVLRHPSDEVTAEQLERIEVAGATSILQVRTWRCLPMALGTMHMMCC